MQPPRRLRGMEDRGPEATQAIVRAGDSVCDFLARYGYRRVDSPVLEETELLLRKSGGELASKMYTFTDPGGHRISLRPEFTSSVVRAYLQEGNGGTLPVRWSYVGPVFRYELEEDAEYRQFTQAGAEIIGAAGPWADAEVLAMACKGLSHLGMTGHRLAVGHLGIIVTLLESMELSERARLFLMSSIGSLSRGVDGVNQVRQGAKGLGLIPKKGVEEVAQNDASPEDVLALLEQYAQTTVPSAIGVRTPQEIRERLLRKQWYAHDPQRFDDALKLLTRVVQVRGEPDAVLGEIRQIVDSPQTRIELDRLEETLKALAHYQIGVPVSLDFGLARGIAYYTGVVFDIHHPAVDSASLGGGGRYDGLVQALGGSQHRPAMGFAWSLERVVSVIAAEAGQVPGPRPDLVLVRPEGASAMVAALRESERLRAEGKMVELEVNTRSLKECLLHAQKRGFESILTVDADGKVERMNVVG